MPFIYSRLQCKHAIITKCSKTLCITFLGAFEKFRRATISFVISLRLSVRPSVRPHGKTRFQLDTFSLNLIFTYFFRNFVKKFEVSLKSDENRRLL